MAIRVSFAGAQIYKPGIWDGPKGQCKGCQGHFYLFIMKSGLCDVCSEQIWKILLDEETDESGAQEEVRPLIEAL